MRAVLPLLSMQKLGRSRWYCDLWRWGGGLVDMPNRQGLGEQRERPLTSEPGPRSRGDPQGINRRRKVRDGESVVVKDTRQDTSGVIPSMSL